MLWARGLAAALPPHGDPHSSGERRLRSRGLSCRATPESGLLTGDRGAGRGRLTGAAGGLSSHGRLMLGATGVMTRGLGARRRGGEGELVGLAACGGAGRRHTFLARDRLFWNHVCNTRRVQGVTTSIQGRCTSIFIK